jgi:hypothetical protein
MIRIINDPGLAQGDTWFVINAGRGNPCVAKSALNKFAINLLNPSTSD